MKNKNLSFFALLMILVSATFIPVWSVAPHPDLIKRVQNREIPKPYYLENNLEIRAMGVNTPTRVKGISNLLSGRLDEEFKVIAILVDFSDNVEQVQPSSFDDLLYGNQTGSLKNYFTEVSYGNLTLVTLNLPSALGWLRAPQTYSYYVNGQNGFGGYPRNAQKLAEDAVNLADPYVDFSQYDNDGDGYVDALFIIHSGPGAEFTGNDNDIWSHKWQMHEPQQMDGVTASIYSMEPEYWAAPGDMTCGVYAHEMGHSVFGLPDLYDYGYDSRGLGRWSLMAGGSWNGSLGASPAHPDAWCRIQMGWVSPTVVSTNMFGASIPGIENNPTIFRLWTTGQQGSEYFLVENRRQSGYDAALPASGLLIYHVDEAVANNDNQWYPGHTNSGHYKVALEQADGLWELETDDNSGDGDDPFPGGTNNRTFDDNSTPDSRDYDFESTDVAVRNISNSAQIMTADLIVGTPSDIPVSLPDTSAEQGAELCIPLEVGNVTGQNITAFEFTVTFDPDLVNVVDPYFDLTGGLADGWTVLQTHDNQTGLINVGGFGTTALSGQGQLLCLQFLSGMQAGVSPLNFTSFMFNEGTPAVLTTNGSLTVEGETIPVSLPDTSAAQGAELCIPLEVGNVTGQNITAFEFTVTFDPDLVNVVDPYFGLTGGLADGWTVLQTHDNQTGLINVGGFGTTALSGQGQLLCLQFQVLPEAPRDSVSPLNFTSFMFNEGTPTAETSNGSLTVLPVGANDEENGWTIPSNHYFSQNYPNPFNPTTMFEFGVPRTSHIIVRAFDILGRQVDVLADGMIQAGHHQVIWNCGDCSSGVYLVVMSGDGFNIVRKATLIR